MNRIWGIVLATVFVFNLVSCRQKAKHLADDEVLIKGSCVVTPLEDGDREHGFELKRRTDVTVEIKVLSGPPVDFVVCDEKAEVNLTKTSTSMHSCKGGHLRIEKEIKQRMTISSGKHYLLISNDRHATGTGNLEAKSSKVEYSLSTHRL